MYARTQTFIRIHAFVQMCMHTLEKCKKKKKIDSICVLPV